MGVRFRYDVGEGLYCSEGVAVFEEALLGLRDELPLFHCKLESLVEERAVHFVGAFQEGDRTVGVHIAATAFVFIEESDSGLLPVFGGEAKFEAGVHDPREEYRGVNWEVLEEVVCDAG